ncbi:uncharacterized protein B0I36DRAFT_132612 [Microdochium trichocladiopsis]|uniref:Uncharacterized protein n=1 Tax=Microdochium trichocladiopsis TaxID=1682393 RepID=A0A9P8Y4J2_9PEZI|nr:uncharacterized protein B0I36DRAFT_132612 [Microdochium trichocladiopsis]KAH7029432.1 hypothetical protein B0I36DRAFT_132612 [Microdochium trichocladiopsis]
MAPYSASYPTSAQQADCSSQRVVDPMPHGYSLADASPSWYCCQCSWTHTVALHPACINCHHRMCQGCRLC